ncbi:chemotaxis protein CheR [Sediminibacillus dalangtanensis]|uniref:protein-glutamate O-methyltransferase n=1 Tax=Sediminibacillus dalangtanensis TaxID=2729421 RepID=A0ABX7VV62_9BACI|nr:protein-glutamate O-methyltransferase CheR [Sediminibacillus dalangtanensis]QTM99655.1 chemotaxis protein CheR [Sediminibacillus dalangtanensis]
MTDYQEFTALIHKKTGLNLHLYKEVQMKRRLNTLREKRGFKDFVSYYHAMSADHTIFKEFLDRVTINVSEFYRNYPRWEVLEKKILPSLLKKKRKLKVWSAACSTGEEPYTIAMILRQYMDPENITIIATDLDEAVLERARKGIYPERSLKEVPQAVKKQYFHQDGPLFRVDDSIKRLVQFKKHNLLSDPFEQSLDLIVCRNVLIYFTEEAKQTVYQNFSKSLNKDGVFFVGSTEQIFQPQQYDLRVIDNFFYQKQ